MRASARAAGRRMENKTRTGLCKQAKDKSLLHTKDTPRILRSFALEFRLFLKRVHGHTLLDTLPEFLTLK